MYGAILGMLGGMAQQKNGVQRSNVDNAYYKQLMQGLGGDVGQQRPPAQQVGGGGMGGIDIMSLVNMLKQGGGGEQQVQRNPYLNDQQVYNKPWEDYG